MSPASINQAFQIAFQHHQAGRRAEAEALYRQILAVQPGHFDALHLLGVLAHEVGRHDLATEWIRQALVLNPGSAAAHSNLGEAYRAMGQMDEAVASFHRALALKPNQPETESNLGNALKAQGQYEGAMAAYRRALQARPDYALGHYNLGIALAEQERFHEAVAAYRQAIHFKPDYPEVWNNLGAALSRQDRPDEAVAAFQRALELNPNHLTAHNNLGNILRTRGQLDEAVASYRRALELGPDYAISHYNLGIALADQGKFNEAIAEYRRALELDPEHVDGHNNLGLALAGKGRLDEAIVAFRRALELKPDYPGAHCNLGSAYKDQGLLDEAVAAYRRGIQLDPDDAKASSNLVYTLEFLPGENEKTIAEEQERWNRQFGEPLRQFILPQTNDRSPERRLRIGYVSPDFRDQVVGKNVMPLFAHHDHEAFEILCYSEVLRPDTMTAEFRQHADLWRSTIGVTDEALAEMIRQDGVDILVDLTQHMADNRLTAFARQPAPVQVSFAGYPASTGLEAIGYRISDRYLESEFGADLRSSNSDLRAGMKEQIFLIDSFWCYDPAGLEVEINALPALENGFVTFGSLNNFCKINEPVLKLWARVLGQVEDSRLMILSQSGSHRQRTQEILEREGIAAQRVEFVGPRLRRAYLELYRRLDIVLDPFPYNGHTTSLDALWMGVPVVSLVGERSVSRAGLSQLSNLGLPELAAFSGDGYVGIATQLAHDLPRVAELRGTLRPRMEASLLMDAPGFARNVERAYRQMWRAYCAP